MSINWNPGGRNIYFFEPHQDDGCLFMAQVAAHHMLAGRNVHVVLMSNGSTSMARDELNGVLSDPTWWGGKHEPEREGYEPLSAYEFGLARTREFRASWRALGVPDDRMHFGMDLDSSALLPTEITKEYASEVIKYFVDKDIAEGLDNPSLYTMWWNDAHADHAACGKALKTHRLNSGADYADSRWLVKPEQAEAAGAAIYAPPSAMLSEIKLLQKRAAWAYGAWQPESGAFAIGMHSVAQPYFDDALRGDPNYIVRNP